MARIPYPDLEAASAEFRKAVGENPLNVMRIMGHAEALATELLQFGGLLLSSSALDAKLRELVILRISALSGAHYETHQHRQHARRAGVDSRKVEAIADRLDDPVFTSEERKILEFVDDVFVNVTADAARFDSVSKLLSPREIIELMTTIGFYMLICRLLVNLDVEIESDG